jgi:hypothetical protein
MIRRKDSMALLLPETTTLFNSRTLSESILRVKSRKELRLLIAVPPRQIDWAGGTNILLAVNYQRCDRGVRN